jgi:hypothetical protein
MHKRRHTKTIWVVALAIEVFVIFHLYSLQFLLSCGGFIMDEKTVKEITIVLLFCLAVLIIAFLGLRVLI